MKRNFIFFKILCLLVLIFSCRQDYLVESNSKSPTSNARMNRVSFEEMEIFLKENTKNNFPNSLDKKYFDKNDNNYITYIDSTSINKIVYGDTTSFTMFINTINDKEYTFSNLIIKTKNGITEEYIYHYKPEEKWLKDFNSDHKRDYVGELKVIDIYGTEMTSSRSTVPTFCLMAVDIPCYGLSCPCSGNGQTIYVKIACGSGSDGGGGGGDGGGNGPTGPIGPGGHNPSDGGGSGGSTTTTATPCKRLQNVLDPFKNNAKPLITSGMYDYINNSSIGEASINFKKSRSGYITSEISAYTGSNSAPIKTGGDYYTAIHTHPKDTYPMFSWADVYALYKLEMGAASHNNGLASLLLVCEDDNGTKQTYAITFEDVGLYMEDVMTNPQNIGCTDEEIIRNMNTELSEKYFEEAKKSNPNYERVFLQQNFGTNIGLYKANASLTNWTKLSIRSNTSTATVTPTNCN